jgi:hypothetical protein
MIACKRAIKTARTGYGSTANLRIAIIDDASQSMRKAPCQKPVQMQAKPEKLPATEILFPRV